MITAEIRGRESPCLAFLLKMSEKKITSFEVQIPVEGITTAYAQLIFESITIRRDGVTLISGIIAQTPTPTVYEGQQTVLRLVCDGEVGRLYLEMPLDAQFQSVPVATIISTLLAAAVSPWLLNDTSTLSNDPLTVDVRDRESLWAQIELVLSTCRTGTYWRYAGYSGGNYLLDIGSFGEELNTQRFTQQEEIIGVPRFRPSTTVPIKEIRPISGTVGNRPVQLSEALGITPALATDPDYPLQVSTQSVINNTISAGRRMRKRYTPVKTENQNTPSELDRQQAALSLYYQARRDMRESAPYSLLSLKVALEEMPLLHSRAWVDLDALHHSYNGLTDRLTTTLAVSIRAWMRIQEISWRYTVAQGKPTLGEKIQPADIYELTLTDGEKLDVVDDSELLFQRLETNDLEDNAGVSINLILAESVTVQHTGIASDCMSGGTPGKLFDFPLPTIPSGATQVTTQVTGKSPASVTYTVVQAAGISPAQNFQLCVTGAGGGAWTVASNVTVTIVYSFT